MISVAELPSNIVDVWGFFGATAVTSESGQGAIIQRSGGFLELTCETSGCSWKILPQTLSPGVYFAVMMTLPPDYTC